MRQKKQTDVESTVEENLSQGKTAKPPIHQERTNAKLH